MLALETEGYDLVVAEDGAQALAQIAQSPADALVLDVMLPGSTGSRSGGGCVRRGRPCRS